MKANDVITHSPLSHVHTIPLLLVLVITICFALWLAHHFRDNYDPRPLLKWYGWYAVPLTAGALLLQVQVALIIAVWLAGAGLLAFRSNHYFYDR